MTAPAAPPRPLLSRSGNGGGHGSSRSSSSPAESAPHATTARKHPPQRLRPSAPATISASSPATTTSAPTATNTPSATATSTLAPTTTSSATSSSSNPTSTTTSTAPKEDYATSFKLNFGETSWGQTVTDISIRNGVAFITAQISPDDKATAEQILRGGVNLATNSYPDINFVDVLDGTGVHMVQKMVKHTT
ncbi:hypothetical protein ATK17_0650 [Branchiibius hedensis]|uniref:Uncharacterized protein n=1 Tax=Branchiibius hedensis TaxID=672460 RepID=A0A2Y8ZN53_9MICO|nr:hypothetical protein [Branchiibius hedensis]PWJ24558.1 hypothetical protein ATK17_0650 [Branchiibius hedensis]SSA33375.1 hypothetical protein SAMN04489750_0650 [Branchiibius hedensis]